MPPMKQNTTSNRSIKDLQKCAMIIIVILCFFFIFLAPGLTAEPIQLTIVHSGNLNGHIFPCPT